MTHDCLVLGPCQFDLCTNHEWEAGVFGARYSRFIFFARTIF